MTGYRAFPLIPNPAFAHVFSQAEFDALEKHIADEAPSACDEHQGTAIWYAGPTGYVVEVRLTNRDPVRVQSLCTFTPTLGMDQIDGMFAQDVEEYVLLKELGRPTDRLRVYGSEPTIAPDVYLQARGLGAALESDAPKPKRPWWRFW